MSFREEPGFLTIPFMVTSQYKKLVEEVGYRSYSHPDKCRGSL